MEQTSDHFTELELPASTAGQFAYHVRMAAVFAVAGETDESASEAVLAWAILSTCWPGATEAAGVTADELIGQNQVGLSEQHRQAAHAKAHALALELEGHFVTTGQHDLATLYATVADELTVTIGALLPDS